MSKINIEQITFKDLSEVAYNGRLAFFIGEPDKVTVHYSIDIETMKLDGYQELTKKEYEENATKLEDFIKNKLIEIIQ